jgi:hypothetical protein
VRADLLAIAAQNVERRLNAMPSFLALVRQNTPFFSGKSRPCGCLGVLPEGQALDIGLHRDVYRY